MVEFLSVCYVIFIMVITGTSTRDDALVRGYSIGLVLMEVIVPVVGAIGMLLYTFSFELRSYRWIWKIVPLLLLACYVFEWYLDFVVYRQPDETNTVIIAITLLGAVILYPMFHTNYKLGYSKEMDI